jgi:hypothetical protein
VFPAMYIQTCRVLKDRTNDNLLNCDSYTVVMLKISFDMLEQIFYRNALYLAGRREALTVWFGCRSCL